MFKGLTLTTLMFFLTACSSWFTEDEIVIQGEQICPDRIWMLPEAKAWLRDHMTYVNPDTGTTTVTEDSLPIRVYLSLQVQQEKRLDICNGLDPNRPSPYATGTPQMLEEE